MELNREPGRGVNPQPYPRISAMKIAIFGTGGVGGYFGGRLAAAGADVHFIARGAHLAALQSSGLRINSPLGDLHLPHVSATDDPARIGPVDLVFFTVKMYDTERSLPMLAPLVGPATQVISFQNGVDSVNLLTRALGKQHVLGGTTYVSAVIDEPGVIKHTAMSRLVFGPIAGAPPAILEELKDLCTKAGFEGTLSPRILVDIWAKFVRLTVFSGMTSIARAGIGIVLADADLRPMLETALHESIHVARAKQIPLLHSIFEDSINALSALPVHTKSSMLEDLERGRRLELPWLSAAVVRLGQEVGVETPTHRLITALLRAHVNGLD
jgi:2-dehydropantoate 2-reductase